MTAILSNSTRKLLWFEISKMLIAVKNKICCVICYNVRHTFAFLYLLPVTIQWSTQVSK